MNATKTKTRKPAKPYWEMTTEELAEATRAFDEESVFEKSKPLSPAMQRAWERAKRKRGRPRNGEGTKTISVSVEKSLLRRADRLAKRLKTSRARLVAIGLEGVLAAQDRR